MAATSRHNGDIAKWVLQVVESCDHPKQEVQAKKLYWIFSDKLDRERVDYSIKRGYLDPIRNALDSKLYERLENLKIGKTNESTVS